MRRMVKDERGRVRKKMKEEEMGEKGSGVRERDEEGGTGGKKGGRMGGGVEGRKTAGNRRRDFHHSCVFVHALILVNISTI